MPNNMQILAYIQAMKDRTIENLEFARLQEEHSSPGSGQRGRYRIHEAYLNDLINLEKFIKGGN